MKGFRDIAGFRVPEEVAHLCEPASATLAVHGYHVAGDIRDHCTNCDDPLQAGSSCKGCRMPYRINCGNPGCTEWVYPSKHDYHWYFMQSTCTQCRTESSRNSRKHRLRAVPETTLRRAIEGEHWANKHGAWQVLANLIRDNQKGSPKSAIWIHGPKASGKTHMVAREVGRACMDGLLGEVEWVKGTILIAAAKRQFNDDDEDRVTIKRITDAEALIIDEILPGEQGDVKGLSTGAKITITNLLTKRLDKGRLTIAVSRRPLHTIGARLDEQLGSTWVNDHISVSIGSPGK